MRIVRLVSIALILALLAQILGRAQAMVGYIDGPTGGPVRVNPVTHRAYFANSGATLSVVEGTTQVATIALPTFASSLALDSTLNVLYAMHGYDYRLSVVDLNTNTVRATVPGIAGGPVVNERTHRAYAASARTGEIAAIDSAGNLSTFSVPYIVCGMAVNDRTNQLFVSHCGKNQVGASVVDLDTGAVTTVPFPGVTSAGAVAVNKNTNRAYVVSYDGRTAVLVIDGSSKATRVLDFGTGASQASSVAVNSSNNRVYVAWGVMIGVIDGANDDIVATTSASERFFGFHVDEVTNKVYAALNTRELLVIDANGGMSTAIFPFDLGSIDIDASRQRIYAGSSVAGLIDASAAPAPRFNYQGLWWNSPAGSESGWGVNIAQQGDVWFAAWFTYDENGDPTWFVMPRGERTSGEAFSGTLYKTTGPQFAAPAFDPSQVSVRAVGTLAFRFSGADNGSMDAVVNGTRVTKAITRQVFAPRVPTCVSASMPSVQNFTDIWWNSPAGSESGWGLFLTHQGWQGQGENLFAVWFMYVNGSPAWFVASNVARIPGSGAVTTFRGTLYRTSGPPFNASPWNGAGVKVVALGTLTLATQGDSLTFEWTVGGLSGQKKITRQAFSTIRTSCN